jgi:vacuolar iron transporter family protein
MAAKYSRAQRKELRRIVGNYRSECDSAELYQELAGIEHASRLGAVFQKLAGQEREHAAFWAGCLRANNYSVVQPRTSLRTRLLVRAALRFGVSFVIPWITARELQDRYRYARQHDASAVGLPQREQEHAVAMRTMGADAESLARGTAALQNSLRAGILAVTDGLTSNFCLLMGLAGGGAGRVTILLAGVAGLVAGACSMALGEWLSLTNARELAGSEIDRELRQLYRDGTQDHVSGPAPAAALPAPAGANQSHWSAHPELVASISFVLFALGASIPLLPFFWTANRLACIGLALPALFALGIVTSFFNGRGALYSGWRQLGIGAAAAAVTYGAGRVFGAMS